MHAGPAASSSLKGVGRSQGGSGLISWLHLGFPLFKCFPGGGDEQRCQAAECPWGDAEPAGGSSHTGGQGWRDEVYLDGNVLGGDSPHGHVLGTSRCPPNARAARGRPHLQVPVYQLVGLEVVVVFPKRVNDLLSNLRREGAGGTGSGTGTPPRDTFLGHPRGTRIGQCPAVSSLHLLGGRSDTSPGATSRDVAGAMPGTGDPRAPPGRASPSASRRRRRTAAGWGGARTCPDPPPAPAPAAPGTAAR